MRVSHRSNPSQRESGSISPTYIHIKDLTILICTAMENLSCALLYLPLLLLFNLDLTKLHINIVKEKTLVLVSGGLEGLGHIKGTSPHFLLSELSHFVGGL